jgi:hypothetical protein
MFEELENPRGFSPDAREVLFRVANANLGDEGTTRLAIRLARAITIFRAGLHRGTRPIFPVALVLNRDAPLRAILNAIGTWIGEPLDGTAPVTIVDCPSYTSQHDLSKMFVTLAQIHTRADTIARAGREYLPLERLAEEFKRGLGKQEELLAYVQPEARKWIGELNAAMIAILLRLKPLRSIIVFDDLEAGSPELIEAVRQLVTRGRIVGSNFLLDLRYSIIIITVYERDDDGITETGEGSSREKFRAALKRLRHSTLRGLADDLGDHIIVIGPTTEAAQRARLEELLEDCAKRLRFANIEVSFTDDFKTAILEESRDPEAPTHFPNQRLEDKIEQYVLLPLAEAVEEGQLFEGMSLTFVAPEGGIERPQFSFAENSQSENERPRNPLMAENLAMLFGEESPISEIVTKKMHPIVEDTEKAAELRRWLRELREKAAALHATASAKERAEQQKGFGQYL